MTLPNSARLILLAAMAAAAACAPPNAAAAKTAAKPVEIGDVRLINGKSLSGEITRNPDKSVRVTFENGSMIVPAEWIAAVKITKRKPTTANKNFFNAIRITISSVRKYSREYSGAGWWDNNAYDHLIRRYAAQYGVDPALVKAVMRAESGFNPRDVSNKGAQGLMQLMPSTARALKVKKVFSPDENIKGGTRYLAYLSEQFGKDNVALIAAAYNAGPNAVRRHRGVPPYKETRGYVKRVSAYHKNYRKKMQAVYAYRDASGGLHLSNICSDKRYKPVVPQ